jgi:hypothetical protein
VTLSILHMLFGCVSRTYWLENSCFTIIFEGESRVTCVWSCVCGTAVNILSQYSKQLDTDRFQFSIARWPLRRPILIEKMTVIWYILAIASLIH